MVTFKSMLAAGFPFVLGFAVPSTLTANGLINNFSRTKTIRGGQAVIAVGYDDNIRIGSHKGAMLIRNSWGSEWGDDGCGWLPYDLIGKPEVGDAWMMVSSNWVPEMLAW